MWETRHREVGGPFTALLWQGEWPTDGAWPALLPVAVAHGLLPTVAFLVLGQEERVPLEVRSRLRNVRLHALAQQAVAEHQIERLEQAASQAGVRVLLLKGQVVARTYPHPAARPSGDVDVLVASRDDALLLSCALGQQGYVCRSDCRGWGHIPALHPGRPGLTVEIHYRLGEGNWALPMPEIWERARPAASASGFLEMDSIDHALYLMTHAVEGHALRLGLRWLYDLTCWTRGWDQETWVALVGRAEAWGMAPTVQLAGALWGWVQGETWEALPFGRQLEPPPAEIVTLAHQTMAGTASARLPQIWRDGAGRGVGGWLRYGWAVLTSGGNLTLAELPRRVVYLMRQHGPSLWRLMWGDKRARGSWDQQRTLYAWLRSGR